MWPNVTNKTLTLDLNILKLSHVPNIISLAHSLIVKFCVVLVFGIVFVVTGVKQSQLLVCPGNS